MIDQMQKKRIIDGIKDFNKKSTKKSNEKISFKDRWDSYNTIASLCYKISAAIGAIVVFSYLFEIRFFPTGLTAAEVIFFVFVAMGFGLVYVMLVGFGAASAIWLINLIVSFRKILRFRRRRGKKGWKSWGAPKRLLLMRVHRFRYKTTRLAKRHYHVLHPELRGIGCTLLSCVLCLVLAILVLSTDVTAIHRLIVGIFVSGFIALSFSYGGDKRGKIQPAKKGYWNLAWFRLSFATVSPLIMLVALHSAMDLVHVVFQQLGIRIMDVSVEVPVNEIDSITRISEILGRPLVDCHRSAKGDRMLVHHADVLWTGVGSTTYLSFKTNNQGKPAWLGPDISPSKQALLRLDSGSVHIISARPLLNSCFDLPNDMLFKTAGYTLTPKAESTLGAIVTSLQADGQIEQIIVKGHSDSRRITGATEHTVGDNQRLSERRAEVVAAEIKKLIDNRDLDITSEGAGSREPKVTCPTGSSTTLYEAQQCNAVNRRVEIRVKYADTKISMKSKH
ncbi:OmpA family protein [Robbsia andropogonis]|uniref:OmpA family protein n=1 Tax=Robbsia andropogonis TaxID=28092 RepID=UPI002A6B4443|nr:OmpA family protein [Robbsia andropogonis]